MKKQVYVSKRSDLSLIGSAFEAADFRCVRIRTECEAEHRTKGGDPRRHGMLILDGDRVILENCASEKDKVKRIADIPQAHNNVEKRGIRNGYPFLSKYGYFPLNNGGQYRRAEIFARQML